MCVLLDMQVEDPVAVEYLDPNACAAGHACKRPCGS